ncbi:GNAT family N-acetyltransferase [Bacillus sp. FJAT-26390]|uniref:GNAT family N-acetyltransferase n=1 Tax=Bacillus sp. FJAT-26390 TaxID=1743142 RepID=UPI000807C498|nr:GNAT family N-acetyltransferase [Bacillus sp. FJAT-26390]OBZ16464.1 acetyltransferase [Bacillus sp. FJAT-26390]
MEIRKFIAIDINQIVSLFYETVHSVNKRDYSEEQLAAWAPKDKEMLTLKAWEVSMSQNITYVAEISRKIVGFADMTKQGHLDRLYVHKDFQGQGIASAVVGTLEFEASKLGLVEVDTEASITAKPFFERQGYEVIQRQAVERSGVELVNFKMVKKLLL